MKITISPSDLAKALLSVSKSLTTRANLPILTNVLLSSVKDKLSVLATDLETATTTTCVCKTSQEGKVTVPGKLLLELVSQIPEGEVVLEKLGEELLVSARGHSARFATMPVEDFPAIPKIEHGLVVKLSGEELASAVSKVAFCAAVDEGRPTLTGILCEISKDALAMVATDGYRLSFVRTPVSSVAGENLPIKIIIPAAAMLEVEKLITETAGGLNGEGIEMMVSEGLNQLNVKIANVGFTTRLIEGSFPPWQKIIPDKFTSEVVANREELVRLIRVASIFARDSGNIIKLVIGPRDGSKTTVLTVSAGNKQVGSNEAQMEVALSGRGGEIAFNFRYLLEMLSRVEAQDINFEMIESLNPGKLTIPGNKDYFYIVMPVRLQS
jgi:DNA polymerase-3 subunit beta